MSKGSSPSRRKLGWLCCRIPEVQTPEPLTKKALNFKWTIHDVRSLLESGQMKSDVFSCDGQSWRLHIDAFEVFQQGAFRKYLSVYVEWIHSDDNFSENRACFKLQLQNTENGDLRYKQHCSHRFTTAPESGFTLFVPVDQVLVADGSMNSGLFLMFRIRNEESPSKTKQALQFGTYGFSILSIFAVVVQYLFHIEHLRKAIERIELGSDKTEGARLMYAIKKVFKDMSDAVPDHIDLMMVFKAYGSQLKDLGKIFEFWEFFQYFAWRLGTCWGKQELSPFYQLFVGNYMQRFDGISTANLRDFELFQLDTIDARGFYDALNNACTLENGQPIKSQESVQNVQRSTQFSAFPPILRLILKRFKYDALQKKNLKLLHFFDFPGQLDISHCTFHYLAANARGGVKFNYQLTSVIAHEGSTLKTGFYVIYVRQDDGWWWKLSENTSMMTEEQVMESCTRSACFLSYTRVNDWDWVMT